MHPSMYVTPFPSNGLKCVEFLENTENSDNDNIKSFSHSM